MSEPIASYKFFDVRSVPGETEDGKPVYAVINRRSGDNIAFIVHDGQWRQWVLLPGDDTQWSAGCLTDVQAFIRERAGKEAK